MNPSPAPENPSETMTALRDLTETEAPARPAFDFFHGYAVTAMFAALEMAGLLGDLESNGLAVGSPAAPADERGQLLEATLRYLTQRGLAHEESGVFTLTALGRAVYRDRGYLVWLVGGYGEPLRHLDAFLLGEKRYGTDHTRDGRWAAGGTALLARHDVVPQAMTLLEEISFDRVLDLGCGNARFLLSVCQAFGCDGLGIDISPEACSEAVKLVDVAKMAERVRIVLDDVNDLDRIPSLTDTQLVMTFFLLHEILARGRSVLVSYLSELASRLPAGAHLLTGEVVPPRAPGEMFTPEFTFVHAMMRQSLLSENAWREVFQEGGFAVRKIVYPDQPGGIIILAQTVSGYGEGRRPGVG